MDMHFYFVRPAMADYILNNSLYRCDMMSHLCEMEKQWTTVTLNIITDENRLHSSYDCGLVDNENSHIISRQKHYLTLCATWRKMLSDFPTVKDREMLNLFCDRWSNLRK